jgi:acetyl esterase/lipase
MKKLLSGALAACLLAAVATVSHATPQPSLSNVVYDTVVENGVKTDLKLDIYLPPAHYVGTRPMVLFVHGGCFNSGSKSEEGIRAPAGELAEDGFVVLSVDYRLAQQAPYPAAMNDVRQALRWARQNAPAYRIDPSRIIAYGQSAGSTLAAMLGVQPAYARGKDGVEDAYSQRVNMVVDFYGRTDFTHDQNAGDPSKLDCAETYLGMKRELNPDLFQKASVLPYVDRRSAPFLIFHGLRDVNVLPLHAQRLHQKLLMAGVSSTLVLQEDGVHNMPNVYAPSMARRADDPNVQQRFAHVLIKKAFRFGHTWLENSWALRIDAGATQPNTQPAGFILDSFAVGGQPFDYSRSNSAKVADPLLNTVRFSETSFAYHLANNQPGFKRIRMGFSEPYRNGVGWRKTDVSLNGVKFLVDFDTFALCPDEARPVMQEVYFYTTSPTTELQFTRKAKGNAAVASVEMFTIDDYRP